MRILYLPEDYFEWLATWQQTNEQEPFSHPGYVSLYADKKTTACAAVYDCDNGRVFYPFLLRDLRKESFWTLDTSGNYGAFDIVSPYGYGGAELIYQGINQASVLSASSSHADGPKPIEQAAGQKIIGESATKPSHGEKENIFRGFFKAFGKWAASEGVVSEFVRFSLFSDARPYYYGTVQQNNINVVCRLIHGSGHAANERQRKSLQAVWHGLPEQYAEEAGMQEAALWSSFKPKVRWMVKKALKNGLTVEEDAEGYRREDFLRVYHATMDRLAASSFYYFDHSYFNGLQVSLKGRFRYFHALWDGVVVSSLLALCSNSRVYLFLLGGLQEYFHLSGNNLVQWYSIMWAQKQGFEEYILGGGFKPYDGIFNFKKSFSPDGLVPFHTGKMIFDKETYLKLKANHPNPVTDYFPEYRSP
jgi:hypothetical protein